MIGIIQPVTAATCTVCTTKPASHNQNRAVIQRYNHKARKRFMDQPHSGPYLHVSCGDMCSEVVSGK